MRVSLALFPALALLAAAAVPAQSTKVVPALMTIRDGNTNSYYPFLYDGFRYQQIWDGAEIATTNATINGIAFRRDIQDNSAIPGRMIPTFLLHMGHSANSPASMSTTYAANVSGTLTTVFNASLNLPAQPVTIGLGNFNLIIPFSTPFPYQRASGDLLAEYEIPGNAQSKNLYVLDAHYDGQDAVVASAGTPGFFTGGSIQPRISFDTQSTPVASIVPGGSITVRVTNIPSPQNTTFINFGLSTTFWAGGFLPFDLGPFGAPGNTLYSSIDAVGPGIVPVSFGSRYKADLPMPIPNNPKLAGRNFYTQAISLDQNANALGVVLSNMQIVLIGGSTALPVTNTMGTSSSLQPTGSFVHRNGAGGLVTAFSGTFN